MSQSKKSLTATQLRIMLSGAIIVVIGLTIFGFYQASKTLTAYASAVAQANGQAHISDSNIQRLQNTKTELEKDQQTVERVKHVVADSANYQNQVITDISAYAEATGVKVVGFTFDSAATSGTASATPTPGTVATPAASGAKTANVTIQLEPTVPYTNFLQFLHAIEQNLTQMRISKISLTKASGNDPNLIAGQSLAIEVYTK